MADNNFSTCFLMSQPLIFEVANVSNKYCNSIFYVSFDTVILHATSDNVARENFLYGGTVR